MTALYNSTIAPNDCSKRTASPAPYDTLSSVKAPSPYYRVYSDGSCMPGKTRFCVYIAPDTGMTFHVSVRFSEMPRRLCP